MAVKKTTVDMAIEVADKLLEEMDLLLWDVTFAKEGSIWRLTYFIDKEGGISIDDCEKFSRAVEVLLDEADFIKQSYTLDVASPGVERALTRDFHYDVLNGEKIDVRLIRADEKGMRDFCGVLMSADDKSFVIETDDGQELSFDKKDTAFVRLHFDF